MSSSPWHIAHSFVECINRRDVDGIVELITDDHLFVDSLGSRVEGRSSMYTAWRGYFSMVPDYTINVSETLQSDNVVVLLGAAAGTYSVDGNLHPENRWQAPAAWKAVVRDGKVAEWHVYSDNEPIRQIMRRAQRRS